MVAAGRILHFRLSEEPEYSGVRSIDTNFFYLPAVLFCPAQYDAAHGSPYGVLRIIQRPQTLRRTFRTSS